MKNQQFTDNDYELINFNIIFYLKFSHIQHNPRKINFYSSIFYFNYPMIYILFCLINSYFTRLLNYHRLHHLKDSLTYLLNFIQLIIEYYLFRIYLQTTFHLSNCHILNLVKFTINHHKNQLSITNHYSIYHLIMNIMNYQPN